MTSDHDGKIEFVCAFSVCLARPMQFIGCSNDFLVKDFQPCHFKWTRLLTIFPNVTNMDWIYSHDLNTKYGGNLIMHLRSV